LRPSSPTEGREIVGDDHFEISISRHDYSGIHSAI